MRGIINNIITFYRIQAKVLGILITNTQKALEESDGKRKANEQAERIENFVKRLTTDLNNMITRIYFLKERKHMTGEQTRTLADFVNFVKTLTHNVPSLLARFQKVNDKKFEEKLDREIEEIEAHVKQRLKEYDEAIRGTSDTLRNRLNKYVSNKVESINKFFRGKSVVPEEAEKAKPDRDQAYGLENIPLESLNARDTQLESFINVMDTNTGVGCSKKSKRHIHLEA